MPNEFDTSAEPLGSTSPYVLYNNAGNEDLFVNDVVNETWVDRPPFNRVRKTIYGMEQDFLALLAASGFETDVLTYTDGVPLQVDRPTQLIERASDPGNLYSVKLPSAFPVVLSGTWATDEPLLVVRSDQALRAELAMPGGSSLVEYKGATVLGRLSRTAYFEDFGAIGDGVTDDSDAIEAAINSGVSSVLAGGSMYKITRPIAIWTSGVTVDLKKSTITQETAYAHGFVVGQDALGSYASVEDVRVTNGKLIGNDDGIGSDYGVAVVIRPPATDPYVKLGGVNSIEIDRMYFSTWAMATICTAVTGIHWHHNQSYNMFYHQSLAAGGYGFIPSTCFDVWCHDNYFGSVVKSAPLVTTDRHAIYISGDPSRPFGVNNVCRGVYLYSNKIDWANVHDVEGFEAAIVLRSPFDCHVFGNTIIGGLGAGIVHVSENAPNEHVSIKDNIIRRNTGSSIAFIRGSGSNTVNNVTVSGNTLEPSPWLVSGDSYGITLSGVNTVNVGGNTIKPTGAIAAGITVAGSVTELVMMPNVINLTAGAGRAVSFSGTGNDGIVWHRQKTKNTASNNFGYITRPTNMSFEYKRTLKVVANGAGSVSTIQDDDLRLSVSVASAAAGFVLTFTSDVDPNKVGFTLVSQSSSVAAMCVTGITATTITVSVLNFSGAFMPAASNSYNIQVQVP